MSKISKKKTHEEYVEELAVKNPDLEVLEEYKNAKTKILHRCKKHGIEFLIAPSDALYGHGCELCHKERIGKSNSISKEEFLEEIKDINPDIELRGEYKNLSTKTTFFCKKHNIEWETTPWQIKRGCGCLECMKEKIGKKNSLTEEEFVNKLAEISPNIKLHGSYSNYKTPTLFFCEKHNVEWETTPASMMQGCGCPQCRSEKISNAFLKTNEEYLKEIKEKNLPVKPLEEYNGALTKIRHLCLIHNVEWLTTPSLVLEGHGCPKCTSEKNSLSRKRTQKEYEELVQQVSPFITVEEEYQGNNVPILHWCHKHDVKWKTSPCSILEGHGCRECWKERLSSSSLKSSEQYALDLARVNPDIEVIGEYVNAHEKILHRCKICGYEWYLNPNNALSGDGCPKCNAPKGEREIRQWLEQYNFKYEIQYRFVDCKDINTLPFDFYLPEENVAIEYDGEQHFRSVDYFGGEEAFELRKKHDQIKNDYCEDNNIPLLRIAYNENIAEKLEDFLFI